MYMAYNANVNLYYYRSRVSPSVRHNHYKIGKKGKMEKKRLMNLFN